MPDLSLNSQINLNVNSHLFHHNNNFNSDKVKSISGLKMINKYGPIEIKRNVQIETPDRYKKGQILGNYYKPNNQSSSS